MKAIVSIGVVAMLAACGRQHVDLRNRAGDPGGDGPVDHIQLLQVAEADRCEVLTQAFSEALASHAPAVQTPPPVCQLVKVDAEHRFYALDLPTLTKADQTVSDLRLATYVSDYGDSVQPYLCHVQRDQQGVESGFDCLDDNWHEKLRTFDGGLMTSFERFRLAFEAIPAEAVAPAVYRPAALAYAAKSGVIAYPLGDGRVWFKTQTDGTAQVTMVGRWPFLACDSVACLDMMALKLQWSDVNHLSLVASSGGAVAIEPPAPRLLGLSAD